MTQTSAHPSASTCVSLLLSALCALWLWGELSYTATPGGRDIASQTVVLLAILHALTGWLFAPAMLNATPTRAWLPTATFCLVPAPLYVLCTLMIDIHLLQVVLWLLLVGLLVWAHATAARRIEDHITSPAARALSLLALQWLPPTTCLALAMPGLNHLSGSTLL